MAFHKAGNFYSSCITVDQRYLQLTDKSVTKG